MTGPQGSPILGGFAIILGLSEGWGPWEGGP